LTSAHGSNPYFITAWKQELPLGNISTDYFVLTTGQNDSDPLTL